MRILFFGLDYHDYTRSIVNEMRAVGGDVTYIDIQPRSLFFKVLATVGPSFYNQYLNAHHVAAINKSRSITYDKIVFLQAHRISLENLSYLRTVQPRSEFTLYNWDSLSNHDYRRHATMFDRVLTFDPADAKENKYGHLPLFCSRFLQQLRRDRAEPGTVLTVGNLVTPTRYAAVESFRRYCNDKNLQFKEHLKISPVVWLNLVQNGIYPKGVKFRSIDKTVFCKLIETTGAAFDFANHAQTGQTMRMIENLCLGKKIVTSNIWIKHEPFYSSDRIYVIKDQNFDGVAKFLYTELVDKDSNFSEYYIQNFVRQLLGLSPLLSRLNYS
jgi:hypothetical protein